MCLMSIFNLLARQTNAVMKMAAKLINCTRGSAFCHMLFVDRRCARSTNSCPHVCSVWG